MDLTKAGTNLGEYLRDNDVPFKKNIYTFIGKFSVKCKELNKSLDGSRHKLFVFQLVREYYLDLITQKYAGKLPNYEFGLLKNYVVSLTKASKND